MNGRQLRSRLVVIHRQQQNRVQSRLSQAACDFLGLQISQKGVKPLASEQVERIRDHVRQERALGLLRFQAMVERF